jgi:DNA primase
MDWARDYLGLSPNPPVIDRADLERRRAEREAQAAAEDEEKIDKARALWRHGQPIDGTPAERYLRNRAISLDLPPTLRFTNIWNPEAGAPLPCLLAAISGPDKQVCAVQRIYLCDDGSGKAEVENPKLTLGKLLNGACRLAPAGPVLGLAEGLETGMSAMAMYQVPVWVACGSRLDQVAIPDMVERLVIFDDRGGEHIALKAAAAHERPGRKITIVYPPESHKDFNDVLQAKLRVAA